MDIDFECVQCGRCCHDLKLPLNVGEAIAWLDDGFEVQVLCQALPWETEPPAADLQLAHRRRRSFAAHSGSMAIRVDVVLAASYAGPCPHLQPDMRCGVYARRPLVCRIYPAEVNPFIALQPAQKACPEDAWAPGRPPLMRGGMLVDAGVHAHVQASRDQDAADVGTKEAVCAALGLNVAALLGEGLVVYTPERSRLLEALRHHQRAARPPTAATAWRYASNRRVTAEDLGRRGALSSWVDNGAAADYGYLGFQTEADPPHAAG